MRRRILIIGIVVLFAALPIASWAAGIPAKVYESGKGNEPIAKPGVKVEVFSNSTLKTVLFSTETDGSGGCVLENVPLGKEVVVKLTKAGYVRQYDVRSFGEDDADNGVILWIGSEGDVKGLYGNLGQVFDAGKGHVYLEITDELTGNGIEGIQLAPSSGKAFDLGDGEYLIANAEGSKVKVAVAKPGYAFDIESATIPLFAGAMTQYYVSVQSGGAVFKSVQPGGATSAPITGFIRRLSDGVGLSGVSVAFTYCCAKKGQTAGPTVTTKSDGSYKSQGGLPIKERIEITPRSNPWTKPGAAGGYKFKPTSRGKRVKAAGATADFKGIPQ